MKSEFNHRFPGEVLASFKDQLLILSGERGREVVVWKFSRRTHKQVIMIAFFVFFCSLLQIGL